MNMGNILGGSTKCDPNLTPTKLGGGEHGRRNTWTSGIHAITWNKRERKDQLDSTSLAILVAYLTCNKAGVTSRPVRFLPLMDSS